MDKGIQHGPDITDPIWMKRPYATSLLVGVMAFAVTMGAAEAGMRKGARSATAATGAATTVVVDQDGADNESITVLGINDGPDVIGKHGFKFFGLGKECSMAQLGMCNYACEQRAGQTARQVQAVACETNYAPANYYEQNPQQNEVLSCVCGLSRPNPSRIADSY